VKTDSASPALSPACDICGKAAVFLDRIRNRHLCAAHFTDDVEERVRCTLQKYAMVQPGDRLAVALSGGKDSTVLIHLLSRLLPGGDLVAMTVDEGIGGYREATLRSAVETAARLGIEHSTISFLELYGKTLDEMVRGHQDRACAICGILRRKAMNTLARRVGASRLATGHNLDDESQSVLMNWLRGDGERILRRPEEYGGQCFIPRVKPLREIPEKEVALYGILKGLFVELPECPYMHSALRGEVRGILTSLEDGHPGTMRRVVEGQARLSQQLLSIPRAERPLRACERCGDPSTTRLCQACRLLNNGGGSETIVSLDR
jgi:uncharacterized protein (TIGR00269 family)